MKQAFHNNKNNNQKFNNIFCESVSLSQSATLSKNQKDTDCTRILKRFQPPKSKTDA